MAYICKQYAPVSAADLLAQLETQLLAAGWTLHDNVSATVKVYKSQGEVGDFPISYIWIDLTGNNITCKPYLWWNSGTHAGNTNMSGAKTVCVYGAGGVYVFAGDKDLFMTRRINSITGWFGNFPRFHSTPFATLTAGCLAGNGIVMSVDNTTNFILNQTYWIIDSAGAGRWRANVVAINPGVSLTVDNLGSALSAGSKIGANVSTFGAQDSSTIFNVAFDRVTIGNGAIGGLALNSLALTGSTNLAAVDPDESLGLAGAPYNTPGLYILQPLTLMFENAGLRFFHGVANSNFLASPTAVGETTWGVTPDGAPYDSGTATLGTNFTLQCLGKLWGVNAYQNKVVIIASGTGAGQTRVIASNTADTLTVNTQWDTNPNATSIFFIYDSAYRTVGTFSQMCYKEMI